MPSVAKHALHQFAMRSVAVESQQVGSGQEFRPVVAIMECAYA